MSMAEWYGEQIEGEREGVMRDPFITVGMLRDALETYPNNETLYLCGDIYGGATVYDFENNVIWSTD